LNEIFRAARRLEGSFEVNGQRQDAGAALTLNDEPALKLRA